MTKGPPLVKGKRAPLPHTNTPKWGPNDTVELLIRALRACEEHSDLSAVSRALKTKLGLAYLKKLRPALSPGMQLVTRDIKCCWDIRGSPRVMTVPLSNVRHTDAGMKGYGLV